MKILKVKEYEEVEIPDSFFSQSGEISAFPSILEKDYFSVRFKKGKPVFQAGGYVGIIPVNSELSLDISPKVPIANLERMVFLANHKPQILKDFKRKYDPHYYSSKSLNEFLVDCFLMATELVCINGLLKFYSQQSATGFFPKGRINFSETIRARSKFNDSRVTSSWSERTPNNAPNQLLKSLLAIIINNEGLTQDRKRKQIAIDLINCFTEISDVDADIILTDPLVTDHDINIPSTKGEYLDAIALAKIILQGKGVSFTSGGSVTASSMILNLAEAFEWYVLAILRHSDITVENFIALDGNKDGSTGARKALFDHSSRDSYINKTVSATPDIVVATTPNITPSKNVVIDVKYKSIKNIADRADLNQIISYAASYKSQHGLLILPASKSSGTGLQSLGIIGGIEFFQYFIDLAAPDIEAQENLLRRAIINLLLE